MKKKDPIVQLKASKLSIKNFFSDLLNETIGFKYQIFVKVLLKRYKFDREIEFRPVHFNSVTKTLTNQRFQLESSFKEILYMIETWLMKDFSEFLNLLSLNTLIFQLRNHYQEVIIWI